MNQLREALSIKDAQIEDWTHRHTEKGLKMHFTITARLPKELARALGCTYIYDNEITDVSLAHELKETEIVLPSADGKDGAAFSFFPDVVYKFKAQKRDEGYSMQCRVHVSTRIEELHELLKSYDGDGNLDILLRPRQGELFEGGTRVEREEYEPNAELCESDPGVPRNG